MTNRNEHLRDINNKEQIEMFLDFFSNVNCNK